MQPPARGLKPAASYAAALGAVVAALVIAGAGIAGTVGDVLRSSLGAAQDRLVEWLALGATVPTLPRYELELDPDSRRAVEQTAPSGRNAHRLWVPARFTAEGGVYGVEVRLDREPGARRGAFEGSWRIHFHGEHRYRGMRDIELTPARADADAREVAARDAARRLGLLAPLSGFAALRVNGADAGVVMWVEGHSRAMLERLGYDHGEFFGLATGAFDSAPAEQGSVSPVSPARTAFSDREGDRRGAPVAKLHRLLELVRVATDAEFERGIPQLLNVEKYLAWNALAWLFGSPSPDVGPEVSWYYDPVTGLFEPTLTKLGRSPGEIRYQTFAGEDLAPLGRRLFRIRQHRERRNGFLRRILSDSDFDVVAESGRRFRSLLAHLARGEAARRPGPPPLGARLRELVEAHRESRALLERNAGRLREILAASAMETEPSAALAGGLQALGVDLVLNRASGIASERTGVAMHPALAVGREGAEHRAWDLQAWTALGAPLRGPWGAIELGPIADAAPNAEQVLLTRPGEPRPRRQPHDPSRQVEELVAESGLPFHLRGDELVLRSGEFTLSQVLVIPFDYRLTLEAGVSLTLGPGAGILTFRGLTARGTQARPIRIRSADSDRPWGSIGVVRAPELSRLEHVLVSGGSHSVIDGIELSGQLAFNASDLELRESAIEGARRGEGLSVKRGRFVVVGTSFAGNSSDGLDAEWAQGSIRGSSFVDNGDDGLDLAGSAVRVWDSSFRGMADKALSVGERSWVSVADSQIVESRIGIASKEDSRVDVARTNIAGNEIGFALYRDKPLYGAGFGRITGGRLSGNLHDIKLEQDSRIELKGVNQNYASILDALTGLFGTRTALASGGAR